MHEPSPPPLGWTVAAPRALERRHPIDPKRLEPCMVERVEPTPGGRVGCRMWASDGSSPVDTLDPPLEAVAWIVGEMEAERGGLAGELKRLAKDMRAVRERKAQDG